MTDGVDLSTVGGRVRWARLRLAQSQDDLSSTTGIPKATISRIETGLNERPRFGTVRKLADALDVRPGWLLLGEGESGVDDTKIAA